MLRSPSHRALARILDMIALGCLAGTDSTRVQLRLEGDEAAALRRALPTAPATLDSWQTIHAARAALERATRAA